MDFTQASQSPSLCLPHCLDNDVEANSYSRDQLTNMIATAAARGCKYIRCTYQFNVLHPTPTSIVSGNLIDWYCYTCFQYGVIPMFTCHGHPDPADTEWNALFTPDGRYRHANKPESEMTAATLNCYRELFGIIKFEAARAGCPLNQIPIQNGNELGRGGSGDWRPYDAQDPANPEVLSAEGVVPASVVTFRSALLNCIREFEDSAGRGFIAVSPSIEAQTTTIMQTEIDSTGWKAVLNAHDKIAIHSYPETAGGTDFNRGYAAYAAAVAYKARTAILTSSSITLPVWVTEVGWVMTDCFPSGTGNMFAMAHAIKQLGAQEVFPFVLCMNSNTYAANVKTDFNTGDSALTHPGNYFPTTL